MDPALAFIVQALRVEGDCAIKAAHALRTVLARCRYCANLEGPPMTWQ